MSAYLDIPAIDRAIASIVLNAVDRAATRATDDAGVIGPIEEGKALLHRLGKALEDVGTEQSMPAAVDLLRYASYHGLSGRRGWSCVLARILAAQQAKYASVAALSRFAEEGGFEDTPGWRSVFRRYVGLS